MENHEAAVAYFDAAIEMDASMGALPAVVRSKRGLAQALKKRGLSGDASLAEGLLDETNATAAALGMAAVLDDSRADDEAASFGTEADALPSPRPTPTPLRPPAANARMFCRQGELWTWIAKSRRRKPRMTLAA